MAQSFEDILNVPLHEISRPKPLPQGAYLCTVESYREDKSTKKQTAFVEYTLRPIQADKDVDDEDLEAAGGLGTRTLRVTFYKTPDALWRLRDFLEHCGIDIGSKKRPVMMEDAIPQAVNCQVIAYVKHEPSRTDPSAVFPTVTSTAKQK